MDRANETWKKYSTNIPSSTSDLNIIHCTGEIYATVGTRGIWKAPLIRDVPRLEWKIAQNETWADRTNLFCTLIIKDGATLTLTGSIVVYGDQKIIVEPGGHLNISGGIITTECGDYWQGIDLLGNSSLRQNTANQGKVSMTNGTIENAREAIMPWSYNDWSKTGGIISATNSTFRNNKRSIQYMAYQNVNASGTVLDNIGIFTNCTFEWTDAFFEAQPRPAITLNGVKGVKIYGCTFQDLRTNVDDVTNRARGIFSIDAGYSVRGKSLFVNPPTHDYYEDTDYDVGEFINLYKGVEHLSSQSYYPFRVDHVKFLNCQEGLTINSVDNAILTRNYFNHDANCPLDIQYAQNLNIIASSGFTVQGNVFDNDLGIPNIGILNFDIGTAENEIYRNKFNNQRTANAAFGRNANDLFFDQNLAKGLEFTCNKNIGSQNDMFVFAFNGSNDQGVRLFQGSANQATLNDLSQNLQAGGYHFRTNDLQNLKYYWNSNAEEPTVFSGNFSKYNAPDVAGCPSNFDGTIVMLDENSVLNEQMEVNLSDELTLLQTDYDLLFDDYTNYLTSGDLSSLHDLVEGLTIGNRQTVKQTLLNASPYLSIELLTELGAISTNIFPHEWYQETVEANIEVFLDNGFRSFLLNKTEPLPTAIYNSIDAFSKANISQRGLDMAKIGDLTCRIAKIENLLLTNAMVSNDLNDQVSIPVQIESRNNSIKRAEMIDHYIGAGMFDEANEQIVLLQQELPSISNVDVRQELMDFIDLKIYLLDEINAAHVLNLELSPENIVFLLNARDTYEGRASFQASNILCFYASICEERDPMELGAIGRSQVAQGIEGKAFEVLENQGEFILYPNPNEGTFVIKGMKDTEISQIEIQDIHGKTLHFELSRINAFTSEIDFKGAVRGIYIVRIWNVDGEAQNIRILKN